MSHDNRNENPARHDPILKLYQLIEELWDAKKDLSHRGGLDKVGQKRCINRMEKLIK